MDECILQNDFNSGSRGGLWGTWTPLFTHGGRVHFHIRIQACAATASKLPWHKSSMRAMFCHVLLYALSHYYTIASPIQLGFAVNITDKVLGDATLHNIAVEVNVIVFLY